ncbi:MAG: carboxymuconolactone decarboxylase family protein [Planctomycetes bacterium]|nr:carboxymuconolactone decarboxylase family protein [Planctomycetota bacterium]
MPDAKDPAPPNPNPGPIAVGALGACVRAAHARIGAPAGLGAALAAAATGRHDAQREIVVACVELGVPTEALVEGALMTHLFAGFPRAIEAFAVVEDAVLRSGRSWPRVAEPERAPTDASRLDDGWSAFARIYGAQADRVRARLAAFAPAFERAVLEDAYGRVLSRPGLDARTRELMSVCALTALDLPRQLHSHLKGALACGATVDDLTEMVNLAADLVAAWPTKPPDVDGARALLTQVVATSRRP